MARVGQVTINDVARRAGVAVSSVSRVLNGHPNVSSQLRQRVEQAARELDFQPNPAAHTLRSGTTRLIGCLIRTVAIPAYAPVYSTAERHLRAHGYAMLLASAEEDPELSIAHLRLMVRRRVDALLFSPGAATLDRVTEFIMQLRIPIVMLDQDVPPGAQHVSAVQNDHASGMQAAVAHLLAQGHGRIAFIGGPTTWRPSRERLDGYLAGLRAGGVTPEPALIRGGAMSQAVGYIETSALLASDRPPTAIIAGGNVILEGVLKAIQERGVRLGRDLALVGCDDVEITQLYNPPITVVTRDLPMVGETVAHLLIAALRDGGSRVVALPTQLIVRGSTSMRLLPTVEASA